MTYSIRKIRRTGISGDGWAEYAYDFYKDGKKINEWYFDAPATGPVLADLRGAMETMKRIDMSFICLDCGFNTSEGDEYYMVHDHIWLLANPADHGMLCIGCLENRLGRTLTKADFTSAPVNIDFGNKSERLRKRLGYGESKEVVVS